jgi:ArsR family transcriptional regulator, arsenate/arsenite/antimonite-responsive transcriptional repressor
MASTWKALADDSRRQVLLILKDGEKSPSELAEHFQFTLPALSTHLRILKDAGLVSERRQGQRKLYSVKREGMEGIVEFLEIFWEDRLQSLKNYVEAKNKKKSNR